MSDNPHKSPPAGQGSAPARPAKAASVYGGRWGPGATPTPHNQPGSIANDPASAPAPRETPEARPATTGAREEVWDNEGGSRPKGA